MLNGGEAELTITDVTFSGNTASDAGGGLKIADQSSAVLTRLTFSGNETHNEGGGAWIASHRLVTIKDSTFTGNHAATTSSGSGYRQWNVTAQVQAMFDTSSNNGFLIRDANEDNRNGPEQSFLILKGKSVWSPVTKG